MQAAEYMGLPNSDNQDLENLDKRFSDDILRIEISGPDQHHLSVVDVPGLFHSMHFLVQKISRQLTSQIPQNIKHAKICL